MDTKEKIPFIDASRFLNQESGKVERVLNNLSEQLLCIQASIEVE